MEANNKPIQTKSRKKGLQLLFLIIVLLVIVLGMVAALAKPKAIVKEVTSKVGQIITTNVSGTSGPINVLLIGNNARDAKNPLSLGTAAGQADILIVAHIDPSTHKVSLISIPRDTLVAMPEFNEPIPKIKSSFELGLQKSPEDGPAEAMKYVSELTGLKINYYIATYFQGFADAIDAVGGIQINIPQRLYDPEHSQADFQPGWQTLNGQQALAFIRIRQNIAGNNYRTDDFQRQDAELQVLNLLKQKLLSSGTSLSEIQKLQQTWQHDVATNIPTSMLIGMGMEASGLRVEQVSLGSVKDSMDIMDTPWQGINQEGFLSGAYYDVLDPAEITKTLRPYGSTGASTGLPTIPDPNTINVNLYGSQVVANQLQQAGFQVQWMGTNATGSQCQIYYPQGQLMGACSIAQTLGTANELISPATSATVITVYYP